MPKKIREQYKVGTHFIAENVKFCKKTNGRLCLRAENKLLTEIE